MQNLLLCFVLSLVLSCTCLKNHKHLLCNPTFRLQAVTVGTYSIQSVAEFNHNARIAEGASSIVLEDTEAGWGDGTHPTTKLCLDFIATKIKAGDVFLDYGTGSGVLSILAAKLGAKSCFAVDVCEDSIKAASRNAVINGVGREIDVLHTKYIYVGGDRIPVCDITVSNILPGPLCRLVDILRSFTKPGGWLCLSGMRPSQLRDVQRAYEPFVDKATEIVTVLSHEQWGDWTCWAFQTKIMSPEELVQVRRLLTDTTFG